MTRDYQHPDEAFLRSIDIHELLPQQEPFVMVSRLVHFDAVRTICEMDIKADNIFVEDGCFSASGMIENIAIDGKKIKILQEEELRKVSKLG